MVAQYDFTFGGTGIGSNSNLPKAASNPLYSLYLSMTPANQRVAALANASPASLQDSIRQQRPDVWAAWQKQQNPGPSAPDWQSLLPSMPFYEQAKGNLSATPQSLSAQAQRYQGLANTSVNSAIVGRTANPTVKPSSGAGYTAPYQVESAQPMSPQQELATKGFLGPNAGGQPGPSGGGGTGGGGGGAPPKIPVNPNPKPLGDPELSSTDPAGGKKPKPYPTEPRPLSAAEMGALADRRLAVDNAYQEALAARERGENAARVSSLAQRQMIDQNFKDTSSDFLNILSGRGLARSPMFAGKGLKRLQRGREQEYGEVESGLSSELSALEEMVNRARTERDMEMARISQDEASMRSNPLDYLLAANQWL